MIPYAPYTISIPLTAWVLTIEFLLLLSVAWWVTDVVVSRRRERAAAVPAHPVANAVEHVLRGRLTHSRLVKMMRRLDVDLATYLQRVPAAQIQAQVDVCAACPHQFLCDEALSAHRADGMDLTFCPHREPLLALARAA